MKTRALSEDDRHVIQQIEQAQALLARGNEQGLRDLERLTVAGHGSAMVALGLAHETEPFGDADEAERWYRAAYSAYGKQLTEGGVLYLGHFLYRRGQVGEAEQLFSEGAARGYPICMYLLAATLRDEKGRWRNNKAEIRRLLKQASEQDYPLADRALAVLFMQGRYGIMKIPLGLLIFIRTIISAIKIVVQDPRDTRLVDLHDFGPRSKMYWRQY